MTIILSACALSRKCYDFPTARFLLESSDNNLLIGFKGTTTEDEWVSNLDFKLISMGNLGKVHRGFYTRFEQLKDSLKDSLLAKVNDCMGLIFVGHSLGGALATIAALYFSTLFPSKKITCITFGSPKVGNARFKSFFKSRVISIRMISDKDLIPKISLPSYKHVNGKVEIDSKNHKNPHSIETYCSCKNTKKV